MEDSQASKTTTTPSSTEPTKLATAGHKKLPLIIASLVVVGLIAGAGYFLLLKKETSPETNTQTTTETKEEVVNEKGTTDAISTTCASSTEPKKYNNTKIGVSFCYPKEWGEATLGKVAASSSAKGDAYEIVFTAKPGVMVSASTTDWKNTITREARCSDPSLIAIDFAVYAPEWKIEKDKSVTFAAKRTHIKNEPRLIISESVQEPLGVCLKGTVNLAAGQYALQTVSYLRQFSDTVSSVPAHLKAPNTLISQEERTLFNELVASVGAAN